MYFFGKTKPEDGELATAALASVANGDLQAAQMIKESMKDAAVSVVVVDPEKLTEEQILTVVENTKAINNKRYANQGVPAVNTPSNRSSLGNSRPPSVCEKNEKLSSKILRRMKELLLSNGWAKWCQNGISYIFISNKNKYLTMKQHLQDWGARVLSTTLESLQRQVPKDSVTGILAEAQRVIQSVTKTENWKYKTENKKVNFTSLNHEFVDQSIMLMVSAFNEQNTDHQITLYNGITGIVFQNVYKRRVLNTNVKNHSLLLLGHTLVPLSEATLKNQLQYLDAMPTLPNRKTKSETSINTRGIREVKQFDSTLRKYVTSKRVSISVISYPIGLALNYFPKDDSFTVPTKQYLYQGLMPSKIRNKTQFAYVLSKYPPSIAFDKVMVQKQTNQPLNTKQPIGTAIMKSIRRQFKVPRAIKSTTSEDIGLIVAAMGVTGILVSSMVLVL
jgi:hypothetical protein